MPCYFIYAWQMLALLVYICDICRDNFTNAKTELVYYLKSSDGKVRSYILLIT